MIDISVVVPVRNAESLVEGCLESLVAEGPREIIVVDGRSSDRTLEIAGRYATTLLDDGGGGLPVARRMGAEAASSELLLLLDVDVVLSPGSLRQLVDEFRAGGYAALQAGLESVGGPGYWGAALAYHHRTGRSRNWFGLVATVVRRDVLLEHGFDDRFVSGEDIELRWRLRQLGLSAAVSTRTMVQHRFAGDDFEFAKDQFLMDGRGLAHMVRKHGLSGARLILLPALAAVRGIALSLVRAPKYVPYFAAFAFYNYVGFAQVLASRHATAVPVAA